MKDNNVDALVAEMMDHTKTMLYIWLVVDNKRGAVMYYSTLNKFKQELLLDALRDVIANCDDAGFRQAAKEIPEYIKVYQN